MRNQSKRDGGRLVGLPLQEEHQDVLGITLKVHPQRQLEQRLRAGELWQDNDLVFPTEPGGSG